MMLSSLTRQLNQPVTCSYTNAPLDELLAAEGVFAVIDFNTHCGRGADPRHLQPGLPLLGGDDLREVWFSDAPITAGQSGDCHYTEAGDLLFMSVFVEACSPRHYCDAIELAYRRLLDLAVARDFSELLRVWNYLPMINRGDGDAECYKQFCLGRERAFRDYRKLVDYPSACAIGHQGQRTCVYLLASRSPITHIENPRQLSAYNYPRQYGPASPSFSRASLDGASGYLYLSGTASVIGHESLHPNDLDAQLDTTFDNIDHLMAHSGGLRGVKATPAMSLLKVYLRKPGDEARCRAAVEARFGDLPAVYLQGDICREELLVEIDGLAGLAD